MQNYSFSNKTHLTDKLSEIVSAIIENKINDSIGLFSGNMGEALFLLHYDKVLNAPHSYNRAIELIEHTLKIINDGNHYHTFCSGLAGVGWAIDYLVTNDFIDSDISESLDEIDDLVGIMMLNDMKNGNYDYLHGASGCILYLLKRRKTGKIKIDEYIKNYLYLLESKAEITSDNDLKWVSTLNNDKVIYDISLSHGISSLIIILSKIYESGVETKTTLNLITKAINFLLKQKVESIDLVSYFPNYAIESELILTNSRLSWCYGDLGISAALLQSGKNLKDKNLMDLAGSIALKSVLRVQTNTGVIDAGFCHGSSGLSYTCNLFFRNTKNDEFAKSSQFWLQETLKMAKFENGLAGFKSFNSNKGEKWINETSLLTGVSGIGMVLLSHISESEFS